MSAITAAPSTTLLLEVPITEKGNRRNAAARRSGDFSPTLAPIALEVGRISHPAPAPAPSRWAEFRCLWTRNSAHLWCRAPTGPNLVAYGQEIRPTFAAL